MKALLQYRTHALAGAALVGLLLIGPNPATAPAMIIGWVITIALFFEQLQGLSHVFQSMGDRMRGIMGRLLGQAHSSPRSSAALKDMLWSSKETAMTTRQHEANILFGRILKAMIQKKGWTQARLAAALPISRGVMSRWISGTYQVSLEHVRKICDVLQLSTSERMELLSLKQRSLPGRLVKVKGILESFKDQELDFIGYVEGTDVVSVIASDFAERIAHITNDNPEKQQAEYEVVAVKIAALMAEINAFMKPLDQGEVRHVMFDPPYGGIFYHRLEDAARGYLFAATANQHVMDDDTADMLVRKIGQQLDGFMRGERQQ